MYHNDYQKNKGHLACRNAHMDVSNGNKCLFDGPHDQ